MSQVGAGGRLQAGPETLVAGLAAQHVALAIDAVEQLFNVGMADRAVLAIADKVLLADIGGVVAVGIFRQEVIERLFLVRAPRAEWIHTIRRYCRIQDQRRPPHPETDRGDGAQSHRC